MSSQKPLPVLLCMMILCNLPSVTATLCDLSGQGLTFSTVKGAVEGCDAGTTELTLSNNQLTSLPSGVFDSVPSLVRLTLSSNQLTSLPSGVFDSVPLLAHLNLAANQLTSLPSGVFDSVPLLTFLILSNNHLTSLPSGVFDKVPLLTGLILSNNQLTSLPSGVFDKVPLLTALLLDSPVFCVPNVDDPDCEALSSCPAGVCGYVFTPTPTPTGRCSENAGVMADESGTYRCGNSQCHQLVAGEWTKIVQTAMSTADSESNADGTLTLEGDGVKFVTNAGHEYYWPCECDCS